MAISTVAPASQVLSTQYVQGAASKARSSSAQTRSSIQGQLDSNQSKIAQETKQLNRSTNSFGLADMPKDLRAGSVTPVAKSTGGIDIMA